MGGSLGMDNLNFQDVLNDEFCFLNTTADYTLHGYFIPRKTSTFINMYHNESVTTVNLG
jgi:hypothetical protein